VSVVVPFLGDADAGRGLLATLGRMRIGPGDELIVADNTRDAVLAGIADGEVQVVRAARERSSYHARNEGARVARRDWILFIDADCIPAATLLDAYFEDPVPARCVAIAGAIVPPPSQAPLAARYARARNFVAIPREPGAIPTPPTGNLMVRRSAFEGIGGFEEGIRSGGDVDFCRRLQAAGLTLELRPAAIVEHPHRERLVDYLRTVARYAAGARWLDDRYPGIAPRWPLLPELARASRDAARLWALGDNDEAAFRALDGVSLIAHNLGYRGHNRAPSNF
jgi:glycosyltransferase involved in cell wall biosynthesis